MPNNTDATRDQLGIAKKLPREPEYMRLPKAGERDPIFGLSRSCLNQLILPCLANDFRPPVRSSVLRRPGAKTGVRLILVESLRAYIQSCSEQASEA
jgi:hypothetical protein